MNSYQLLLNSSWFYLIILSIVAVILSYFAYSRTIPPISIGKRNLLISLRSIGLILLILMLFEPIYQSISGVEFPPKISVLYDNSQSMKELNDYQSKYDNYQKAIQNSKLSEFDDKIISSFGFTLNNNIILDSILYNEEKTDISLALRLDNNDKNENIKATVIFSDGNFNTGKNPIYLAEKYVKPIYTVGIGDTNQVKDIILESIITNEIAYLNNPVPINVNFRIKGYFSDTLELILSDNGKELGKQRIEIYEGKTEYSAIFEYKPSIAGDRKIQAFIRPLESEITNKNNISSEYIKVIENKKRISIFSGSPSSDISFLIKSLNKMEGIKLSKYIQKSGSNFYNSPNSKDYKETDVFILCGFPNVYTPASILEKIKNELKKGKSLLFISSFDIDYKSLKILEEYLPFDIISNNNREYMASIILNENELSHPSIRLERNGEEAELWNNLPPIYRTEIFTKAKLTANTLMSFKVNNVVLDEPLFISNNLNNRRSMAVLAYGLYRWKLMDLARNTAKGKFDQVDLYDHLIQNSIKWLSVNEKSKQVKIRTNKKRYTNNEKVQLIAEVYDGAYNSLDDAEVKANIISKEDNREITLNSIGNGRYISEIEGLIAGDYRYSGKAIFNNKTLGSDAGRFDVGEVNLEFTEMNMNIELLKEIAELSGGKFYFNENTENLLSDIEENQNFKSKNRTIRSELAIWNLPFLLLLSILSFSFEWYIRKKTGMV